MSDYSLRSRLSTTTKDDDEPEFLDTEEQEAMIKQLHQRSETVNKIYRLSFAGAGFLLTLIYAYFAKQSEEFGESSMGPTIARFAHTLTALGCFIVMIRAILARKNKYGVVAYGDQLQELDQQLDELQKELNFDDNQDQQQKVERSFANTSSVTVDDDDNGPLFMKPENITFTSDLTKVIDNPDKVDWKEKTSFWRENAGLLVVLTFCVLELTCWFRPMRDNWQLDVSTVLKKPALFIFPFILPLYTVATEYALILMQRTEDDIFSLHDLKYHYKEL